MQRHSGRLFLCACFAIGCGDTSSGGDASTPGDVDASLPLTDPGTSLSDADDEGAGCLANMVATPTGVAIIYRRYPLGGEPEVVFARVAFDGTVELAPTVVANGTPSKMTLMNDGAAFMAILPGTGLDLDENGIVTSSSPPPSGIEQHHFQVGPALYWTTFTSSFPFRANFVSFGPGRTGVSNAARLFPSTEEEQSGTKAAVVIDGVWVGYRSSSRLKLGKVDLNGGETMGPFQVINFPNTPKRITMAAIDSAVLVGAKTTMLGSNSIHSFIVYDNSGVQIGERIDLEIPREESPTSVATAFGGSFQLVHERDLDGAFTRIAVARISATDGSGTTETLTPPHFSADCPVAVIAGGKLAIGYRAFDPAPVRRVRFYNP